MTALRIAIAGAGGIGAFFGARLRHAGCEVQFLARGAHGAALRDGLTLDEADRTTRVPIPVLDTADRHALTELTGTDWVLFATKSQHTRALAQQLKPHLRPDCHIGSFQNGVDNEPILAEVFGRTVMGGLCRGFFAHVTAPGCVQVRGQRYQVVVGDYPTGLSARIEQLAALLTNAGFEVQTSADVRRALWLKLVLNNAINPPSALVNADSQALLTDPDYSWVVRNLIREAAAAAAADEVEFSARELDEVLGFLKSLAPIVSSMQTDAAHGRPLELDAITGAVVRRAAALGIEVPVTATLHHLLAGRYGNAPAA